MRLCRRRGRHAAGLVPWRHPGLGQRSAVLHRQRERGERGGHGGGVRFAGGAAEPAWYGAELQAFGRADFDVDGEIPGLGGHLYCKTYLFEFEDEPTDVPPPCWVQKRTK